MTERVLVLGGGVVGLLAAARHRDAGADVVLVDAAQPGGLLRSVEIAPGTWVDHGTHVPTDTGDPTLDRWLFGDRPSSWVDHDRLLAANVFCGTIDPATPFPDLNRLPPDVRARVEASLRRAHGTGEGATTAADELDAIFGPDVRREVFEPLLASWYDESADRLGPGAHLIGASRVVAFTEAETAELKAHDPDVRLAWHDARIGASPLAAHYPAEGGCGAWVEFLLAKASGVRVLADTRASLSTSGDRVVEASLSDGTQLAVDRVVSTLPRAVLLLSLGRRPKGGPPRFVDTALVDLVVDRPLASDQHYATFLDASSPCFRATLYPNLRGAADVGPFVVTVEVLGEPARADPAELVDVVLSELRSVGIVARNAELVSGSVRRLPAGFPVPAPGLPQPEEDLGLVNVDGIGRGAGGRFFLRDVLLDAHQRLP